MAERVLTTRELNRALLARQLLLERSQLSLVRALEQVAGLQTQYAPSGYIGLWSRLARFELPDLTKALERRKAIQGTLMRSTIHLVSPRDYWPFAVGSCDARREGWLRYHRSRLGEAEIQAAAGLVRSALAGKTLHRDELLELVRPHDPTGGTALWNGLAAWIDLVRVPPSGTWKRRRADLYARAEDWVGSASTTPEDGMERLLRSYLRGFGPARLSEAADWAGLSITTLRPVVERLQLRRFRDEEGKELLDLPRARLPPPETPAPVRFLPTWDATLLAHARATQILPERFRPLVFSTKTPQSMSTFAVDGAVAGSWRVERTAKKATLTIDAFEKLPRASREAVREEAEALVRFAEPDAPTWAVVAK